MVSTMLGGQGGQDSSRPTPTMNPLTYYQKPIIGEDERLGQATSEPCPPVQLIFPTGGFGIGVVVKDSDPATAPIITSDQSMVLVTTGPMNDDIDIAERRWLKLAFVVLALTNLIITSLIFMHADIADSSKSSPVDPSNGGAASTFEVASTTRRNVETVNYAWTVVCLGIGVLSVVFEYPLGVAAYALSVALNFILGTSALPLFVYSFRYVFDVTQLYMALVIRSRLTYTFLPLHVHRS